MNNDWLLKCSEGTALCLIGKKEIELFLRENPECQNADGKDTAPEPELLSSEPDWWQF